MDTSENGGIVASVAIITKTDCNKNYYLIKSVNTLTHRTFNIVNNERHTIPAAHCALYMQTVSVFVFVFVTQQLLIVSSVAHCGKQIHENTTEGKE